MQRLNSILALSALAAGTLWAADDPFCGTWKLNQAKSKVTGEQMKIEDLGDNKLKFTFGEDSDTITVDGTDQPVHYGQTMSLTKEGPNSLKMVFKKDGRVMSSMTHTLSDDGNTQTIKGTSTKPDGTTSDFEVIDKRVGGGSGWTGTWESTDVKFTSPNEWEISAYGSDGLTFYVPAYKDTLSVKFDGKDYAEKGPDTAPGSMSSATRPDPHTVKMTDKVNGKVVDHQKFEVSPDGKTLTLTLQEVGQPKPMIFVYDKT
jgi:hypothetical protein